MKTFRQIVSLAMALLLLISCPMLVSAQETTGSIRIENAVTGKTYAIYRIFDLESHSSDYGALAYQIHPKWKAFFAAEEKGADYVTTDELGYVTWKTGMDPAEFAKKAAQWAQEQALTPEESQTAADGKAVFSQLPLGYYLVQSELGALCSLDTTTPDVTIREKNSAPTNEKKVQEDSDQSWGGENDGDMGQEIRFQSRIQVADGAPYQYVFHDEMSSGLTFLPESLTVTVGGTALAAGVDYRLVQAPEADCTFEIHFTDTTGTDGTLSSVLRPNDTVEIAYSAVLDQSAAVGAAGNANKSRLTYGDEQKTQWSETKTYTWKLDVLKYTSKEQEILPLGGAQFVLYQGSGEARRYALADSQGRITGWSQYRPGDQETPEGTATATVFVSPDTGRFTISGLDSGDYFLEEIQQPAGYNRLKDPVAVSIDKTGKVTWGEESTGEVRIENRTGTELPSTGGAGTKAFYTAGSMLALGAGVLLVVKKRTEEEA